MKPPINIYFRNSMSICIVGAGVAGLILLLLLHPTVADITIIDPYFDTGDLCRRYGSVISNTRWEQALQALERLGPIPAWARALSGDQPTPLAQIARLVREMAQPALRAVKQLQTTVIAASYSDLAWSLKTADGHQVRAKTLCITTGAEPKSMNLPIPAIPLEIALDPARLATYIQPNDSVVVFGTNHSGTLVLRNCVNAGVASVVGLYRGTAPFRFASDGEYDGLKLDAAVAAKGFLASPPPALQLAKCDDTSCSFRAIRKADWVVYAIGFHTREPFSIHVNGEEKLAWSTIYNGQTGELSMLPAAWGFGIAYPSQAPDGQHWDVGIAPFVEHMSRQQANIAKISIHS